MKEIPELANAMLVIAFAAVMLVAGEMYIQSRPERVYGHPIRATGVSVLGQAPVNLPQ